MKNALRRAAVLSALAAAMPSAASTYYIRTRVGAVPQVAAPAPVLASCPASGSFIRSIKPASGMVSLGTVSSVNGAIAACNAYIQSNGLSRGACYFSIATSPFTAGFSPSTAIVDGNGAEYTGICS